MRSRRPARLSNPLLRQSSNPRRQCFRCRPSLVNLRLQRPWLLNPILKHLKISTDSQYVALVSDLSRLLETARRNTTRVVNAVMTATYWETGHRIVKFEQGGARRAAYGDEILPRLAADLTARFGRGFSPRNLHNFRQFYFAWPISQTLSAKSAAGRSVQIDQPVTDRSVPASADRFPLPWSHYV
ncbi:MAG: DUF1016 domain-containing protein [Dechloromonas sp.]|nr:MAG: DUF1016 domain-containing protein [Dechloromonas sp.]